MTISVTLQDKHPNLGELYGNKASGLISLQNSGFNVPDFYIIPDNLIKRIINDNNLLTEWIKNWVKEYSIDENTRWAVRSSSGAEDGLNVSMAGQFHTELDVYPQQLETAVLKVINSYHRLMDQNHNAQLDSHFAVIIQQMIKADYAGIVFSQNPHHTDDKSIVINILPGLGHNLVSGNESGLAIFYRKRKFEYEQPDVEFVGFRDFENTQKIVKTGREIITEAKTALNELIEGVKKLVRIYKFPLDIEFAIADEKLYWLQVRPITTIKKNEIEWIYDNSNIGENYPGLSLPLTISFVQRTYFLAYSNMAFYLGMDKKMIAQNHFLFKNMVGGIYGALFYNITAWQQLLYQFPFGRKTSKAIPRLLGMQPADFKPPGQSSGFLGYLRLFKNVLITFFRLSSHQKQYVTICENALTVNEIEQLKMMSYEDLIEHFQILEEKLAKNWLAPVLNGFYMMIFYSLLKKIVFKSRIIRHYPNFINDMLYAQGDIISVKIVREYQDLLFEIHQDQALYNFFDKNSSQFILAELESNFPDFNQKIKKYIADYGARCEHGELKMETRNYQDNPLNFIDLLRRNIPIPVNHFQVSDNFEFRSVLKELYPYNPMKREILIFLSKHTIRTMRDRENYRFMRTRIFTLVRNIFRQMDEKLLRKQLIDNPGDSLYLEIDELLEPTKASQFKGIIKQRKQEYQTYELQTRYNRYRKNGNDLIPIEMADIQNPGQQFKGTGCSGGWIKGKVKKVDGGNVCNIPDGYILVAHYFEPGLFNLFSKAKGLVSEKGNILSHTAILSREMGIPSVIGVRGIMNACNDDDIIELNGTTGEIKILQHGN